MKIAHYILVIVFFLGISFLNFLLPFDVTILIVSFLVVYLLHVENLQGPNGD